MLNARQSIGLTNLNASNTFVVTYPSIDNGFGPDFPDEIFDMFNDSKISLQGQGYSNLIAEEMAMAYALDKYNTGIALLKQDSNGNFKSLRTEKSTSNGTIIYTAKNCQ